jgi:hypothetical protein
MVKEKIFELIKINNRVCPNPQPWNELWNELKNKKRVGSGWHPPAPLILAAWHHTSDIEKANRLLEQVEWAEEQSQLDKVFEYLNGLLEQEWHHYNE